MEKENHQFPENFLWGTATASHQVEGGAKNDWSGWEKKNSRLLAARAEKIWKKWQQDKFPEMFDENNYISGNACDHYTRFEEDFDLAKEGGHNAHRFSVEWSRVEPEEGKFDEKEIEHYQKVILALKKRGIEPMITLWHFTLPNWLAGKGGWGNPEAPEHFVRYAEKIAQSLDSVKLWITLNEPDIYILNAYQRGIWPPGKKKRWSSKIILRNLIESHKSAYSAIHRLDSGAQVGIAKNNIYFTGWPVSFFADRLWNRQILSRIGKCQDFIGLNYYFHRNFFGNENKEVSDLNWEIYPEGVHHILKDLKKYNFPIYVTENGLADADDSRREKFIRDHLFWIQKAIQEGADVRGYFHWSLLDNFEWDKGFWPRFGLIAVDRKTLERKPRKSFYAYQKIIKNNTLN